mgnify:FL=1
MLSIVIPIYNEAAILHKLYDRLTAASPSWKEDYEIILVDDGSYDASLGIMKAFAEKDPHFKIVKLSRNFGHQAAISAGLKVTRGEAVVIMDGDLQDPPEQLPIFLEKWREGFDVVYAIRTKRKEGFFKKLAYKVFYRLLAWISDIDIPLDSGDFCVMDRRVVEVMLQEMPEQNRFVRGLRAFAGFNQVGVAYEREERAGGEAKYTFRKLLNLALDGLFDFSTFPLKLAIYIGLFVSFTSFLVGIFFIFHRIFNFKILGYSPTDTPGLATLAVGIFFLSGVILIFLGVIGEYIGRMYLEVKRRPFFIIEEIVSHDPPSESQPTEH